MKIFALVVIVALCCFNSIDTQVVTTCSQCRYGQCEQLQFSLSCHCVMGVKGTFCDRLLENGENFCLSNPCWNGGTCNDFGSSFTCSCPVGFSGADCRTVNGATFATQPPGGFVTFPQVTNSAVYQSQFPVTFPPVTPVTPTPQTTVRTFFDKKIVVTNKGAYTASLELVYYNPTKTVQLGSILGGQAYAFYVPGNVDYNSEGGCTLEAFANAGEKVMTYRVRNDPECIHIWGTTLNTEWSPINC